MSESVPSSATGFAHRRSRSDSMASFTYFQEDDETPAFSSNEALVDGSDEESNGSTGPDRDIELNVSPPFRRKSSGYSRASIDPLLYRHDSTRTDISVSCASNRKNQKIYVVAEDLTIVVAGFSTRIWGLLLYIFLCTVSLGIAYILFRWLPRWRVRLIGASTSLRNCAWVVVEVCGSRGAQSHKPKLNYIRISGVILLFRASRNPRTDIASRLCLGRLRSALTMSTTRMTIPY